MDVISRVGLTIEGGTAPRIERSLHLNFVGDWGQANFHRICGWLTQEFCDRAGPNSTITTHSMRDGGLGAILDVHNGKADLCIGTPKDMLPALLKGEGLAKRHGPLSNLCALATLPQRDRMVLAVDPKYGVKTWYDIHRQKPPLRISTSADDGTNFVGYLATRFLEAHGLTKDTLEAWGGALVRNQYRPEQCTDRVVSGEADSLLHEAIMSPWWRNLVESSMLIPIPNETAANEKLGQEIGLGPAAVRAGYWDNHPEETPAIDFSDFVIMVRDDMPEDVAYLLTWIIINTRIALEAQYHHIPAERSPLTWPLDPKEMAKTTIPLHPGARKFYTEAHLLSVEDSV